MKPNEVKRKRKVALLIIDMINTFNFPQGEKLLRQTRKIAESIRSLKKRATAKRIPVIYVNDNFGQWRSDLNEVYTKCTKKGSLGKEIAEALKPGKADYFILKPRHSGFYCSSLEILLGDLGVENLIVTGISGNICVLFTVNDAHMRGLKIWVPEDCIASNSRRENSFALEQIKNVLGARIANSKGSIETFIEN